MGLLCGVILLVSIRTIKKHKLEAALKNVGNLKVDWNSIESNLSDDVSSDATNVAKIVFGVATVTLNNTLVVKESVGKGSFEFQNRNILIELNTMRELAYENINQIVGICSKAPNVCVLMAYAERGTLQEVVQDETVMLNWDFKISLLTDVETGMGFLHQGVGPHGRLSSFKCMVDSKWTCKIIGHGYGNIRRSTEIETVPVARLLWEAPELLRQSEGCKKMLLRGTKEGDVYSFAIIIQELILEAYPFSCDILDESSVSELVSKVEVGYRPPYRPNIPTGSIPDEWKDLMDQCWIENPDMRPTFPQILDRVAKIIKSSQFRFVDKMIHLLEQHTKSLEKQVEKRRQELNTEREKVVFLLQELLPATVTEQLSVGKPVAP